MVKVHPKEEMTFLMIKPDGVRRGLIGEIIRRVERAGLKIVAMEMYQPTKEEMDKQREFFVTGAIANGINKSKAEEIFDLVDKFAGYGFNKSHAAAYALISYQTAYLKANFPVEFLTTSINLEIDNSDKINIFLQVAKEHGIKILLPDVNQSDAYFTTEKIN